MLYMQQFKYSIRYIPGRKNAADALSGLPVDSSPDAAIKQTEEYVRTIVAAAIPAALAPRQVERESERDPTLQLVRHAITSGDWSKLQGTTYKAVRDELWIMGQLVMRENKVAREVVARNSFSDQNRCRNCYQMSAKHVLHSCFA